MSHHTGVIILAQKGRRKQKTVMVVIGGCQNPMEPSIKHTQYSHGLMCTFRCLHHWPYPDSLQLWIYLFAFWYRFIFLACLSFKRPTLTGTFLTVGVAFQSRPLKAPVWTLPFNTRLWCICDGTLTPELRCCEHTSCSTLKIPDQQA